MAQQATYQVTITLTVIVSRVALVMIHAMAQLALPWASAACDCMRVDCITRELQQSQCSISLQVCRATESSMFDGISAKHL